MQIPSQTIQFDGELTMHRGGALLSPVVAYETWGTLRGDGENAIVLFTGLSPSAHASSTVENPAAGWWEDMIGSGLPLDTDRYFVICVNSLGSCFGSTGPASIDPATGEPYRLTFPTLSLEDVAEGGYEVVRQLGLKRVYATIGCSMGGMTALAFCVQHPELGGRLVSISSAVRALPFSIAIRSLQREMIVKDPKWDSGDYLSDDPPVVGQRLARKLGMMTYRSPREWEQRFGRERISLEMHSDDMFYGDFAVESYLENHANRFTGQFDANCYLYLSRASDLFDLAEHGGSIEAGIKRLNLESALVIGVQTDLLFPIRQQRELADLMRVSVPDTELVELDCIKGHDSFLVEMDAFRPVISRYFAARNP